MPESKSQVEVRKDAAADVPDKQTPLSSLRQEIDRLFDDFDPWSWPAMARDRWPSAMRMLSEMPPVPAMDLVESDGHYEVSAELPGLDPENIDITVAAGTLRIKGEKREESDRKEKDHHVSERRYGSFQRVMRLPEDADADAIEATCAKGVLTVRIPKSAAAKADEKKISVQAG